MKKITQASLTLLILFTSFLLFNCGGKASEEATNEDEMSEESTPTYSHETVVGIQHEVEDFDKWLAVYNEKSGEAGRISVYRMNDNPNVVVLFRWTMSHEEAKANLESAETKATMAEAGVIGEPTFTYYDMKYANDQPSTKMYRIGLSHEVKDYDAWKPLFDEDAPRREEAGMELRAISTDADNPNMVNIMFATDDISAVEEMMSSEDLKAKMEAAGVISEPTVMILKVPASH